MATVWWVFSTMSPTKHAPVFHPINFDVDVDARRARLEIPGLVLSTGEPIRNPITGAEHRVDPRQHDDADRVILVARSGKTSKPALRRACDLLLQVNARVMGIVLNALDLHSGDGYYYTYGSPDARLYYDEASPQDETTTAGKVS